MYAYKSVACLALFLALIELGSGLQCYHCTSQGDPKCAETFTSTKSLPIDCNSPASTSYNQLNLYAVFPADIFGGVQGTPKYCHKVVLETGTVVRTCLEGNAANKEATCKTLVDETKTLTPDRKVKSCMVCDKDNCNGAGAISVSLPLSMLALVISYLVCKQ